MKLFINYRRDETDDFVARLVERLSNEFGKENIFKDVDSILPGQDWKPALERSVKSCDVVLAIIGRQWTTCTDNFGQPRLFSEQDWVRYELEQAHGSGRIVMPILVKGAPRPEHSKLPPSLQWIHDKQFTEIRGERFFDDDVVRLVKDLQVLREQIAEQLAAQKKSAGGATGPDTTGAFLQCTSCKRVCPRTDQYCEGCGNSLWTNCPSCNQPIPAGQRFCKACGVDVVKVQRADAACNSARETLLQLASIKESESRLELAERLIADLDVAMRESSENPPLQNLRRQAQDMARDSASEAAEQASAIGQDEKAIQLFVRLLSHGGDKDVVVPRMNSIGLRRDRQMADAAEVARRGDYKHAIAVLSRLRESFPSDASIAELQGKFQAIYERALLLFATGMRDLSAQRLLVALDRELSWLRSQHIQTDKVTDLVKKVRRRIESADSTIAEASVELMAGNFKSAGHKAHNVLAVVADHQGARDVARSAGQIVERIARLEELVSLEKWCAANAMLPEIEALCGTDPKVATLKTKTKAAIRDLNASLLFLGSLAALLMIVGIFGVPWLNANALPAGWSRLFFANVWAMGSLLLLGVSFAASGERTQMVARVLSFLPTMSPQRSNGVRVARSGSVAQMKEAFRVDSAPLGAKRDELPPSPQTTQAQSAAATAAAASTSNQSQRPATYTAPPDPAPAATVVGETPRELSSAEVQQRMDSTATAIELIVAGALATQMLQLVLHWLLSQDGTSSWNIFISFGALAVGPFAAAFYIRGLEMWRSPVVLMAAYLASLALSSTLMHATTTLLFGLGLYVIYVGAISAFVCNVRLWKGALSAVVGPVAAFLISSPFIVIFAALASALSNAATKAAEMTSTTHASSSISPAIGGAALVWCMLVVVTSSTAQSPFKYLVKDYLFLQGILTVGLAFTTAAMIVFIVALFATVLNDQSIWLTRWIAFFVASQAAIPFLRWEWRKALSPSRAACSMVLIAAVVAIDWIDPGESIYVVPYFICVTSSVVLLNVVTCDVFKGRIEVAKLLRARIRRRKLPWRIEVRRK